MKKLLIVLMMSSIAYAAFGEGRVEPADDTDLAYLNPTGYPIVNEEIEISVVAAQTATQPHFNESLQIPLLEEITGIKVDWQLTPWTSRGDKKNILMASGDYPDVLFRMGLNANDITTYGVEQQSFLVLDDLIDEYAPNLTAITDEYPFILDHMRATDGHIYALPRIKDPAFASMMSGARLYFRVDWLEQLGLSEPTTTDELYEVLRAFKESDMNGNGEADEYPFYGMALGNFLFNMSGSWGLMNRGQTNQNIDVDEDTGELRFIKADPMYREMLKYVNKLYTEELINYDIFTWSWGRVQSNMLLGLVGAYGGWATTALTDEIDFTGFNAMEGPFGDRLYSAMGSPAEPRFMAVITDANPYPEATMRWLDYMYSDEAAVLFNMGVEDVSYTVDGGNYVFTDLINDNPEGLSQSEARNLYHHRARRNREDRALSRRRVARVDLHHSGERGDARHWCRLDHLRRRIASSVHHGRARPLR